MKKYMCILLILAVFTTGIGIASTSSHGRTDDVSSRPTEMCVYIGIPMAEEDDNTDDNTDDVEDDDSTEDDNSHPSPCELIQFPEAVVDEVIVPTQDLDSVHNDEADIGFTTPGHRTVGEII